MVIQSVALHGVGYAIHLRLEPFEVVNSVFGHFVRTRVIAAADLLVLLASADVAILALPLSPSTDRMADAWLLAAMNDGAPPSNHDLWRQPSAFIAPTG